jgi:hypothetical protein
MLYKPVFGPTLDQIHDTLAAGFDGFKLSNGQFLTASNKTRSTPSGGQYPFLSFRSGSGTFSPWKDFQWSLAWDIPARLTVQGPSEDGEGAARQALNDLVLRTTQLVGLPIDAAGKPVPLGPDTLRLFDSDSLEFLCERGAPFVKSFTITPIDDGVCAVDIIFHVEATISYDQREMQRMKVGVLGVNPVAPDGLYQDTTADDGRGIAMVFGTDAERAWGGYASDDPTLPPGFINSAQERPQTSQVASPPLNQQTASVNVTPYSVSLSVGTPTAALAAIAFALDASSQYVTQTAQWSSTNAAVATVSSSGVVTRVAAGSCTVSCIYNGVASNSVAVTCS